MKRKKNMIQSQENTWTDRRTDPILQDPSGYHWRFNKYNCSGLVFISQRYIEQCWSNQKLLHHNQHAKNQLNSLTHSLNTADLRVSWTKWLNAFFNIPIQKALKQLLGLLNLHQHANNYFIQSFHSCDTVNLRPVTRLVTPFFGQVHPKNFWPTFTLYKYV